MSDHILWQQPTAPAAPAPRAAVAATAPDALGVVWSPARNSFEAMKDLPIVAGNLSPTEDLPSASSCADGSPPASQEAGTAAPSRYSYRVGGCSFEASMTETVPYDEFIRTKKPAYLTTGISIKPDDLPASLFPFQRELVSWALERARAALFADCGLGKTAMQLVWAQIVAEHTQRPVLILAPLAVAKQTQREGEKFGVPVTVCRIQDDVRNGVNVANYEMLEHFDPTAFSGVVLDESGILKNYMGATKRLILEMFSDTPYRLACTATPAPNDHMELGNQAEFLGVMRSNEMLMRWFINDTMQAGAYRLKKHAADSFWEWMSSWAAVLAKPSDIGFEDAGFDLPQLEIKTHVAEADLQAGRGDQLFRTPQLSSTGLHRERRFTLPARAEVIAELVKSQGQWLIWVETNAEADKLRALIPEAVEVRGSDTLEAKERTLLAFLDGTARIMIAKPSMFGYGLNLQMCHQMAFVGLSYSFEQFYQALRRCWRFGQQHPVTAHVILSETEMPVMETVQRKHDAHKEMVERMIETVGKQRELSKERGRRELRHVEREIATGDNWQLWLGDCVECVQEMPDHSVGLSVFSPPFANLYIYSDSDADMGNSADEDEFFRHFSYLLPELRRITKPGRLCAIHCKDLPKYMGRDGAAGLKDFPGMIRMAMEDAGWIFHSRITIWKCPVIEMQRTKNHGLLYKNLRKDSCGSRQGMADYVLVFRNWDDPDNWVPVPHEREDFPLSQWQEWASPVWMDIRPTDVLNVQAARDDQDERHLCPLQLDLIERCVRLWSNPGDVVFTPFAGIGSELYQAIKCDRRGLGVELKRTYWEMATRNLRRAESESNQLSLEDLMG